LEYDNTHKEVYTVY